MSFYEIMNASSNEVSMEFNREKYDKFIKYMRLVQEWNNKINLTAIVEPKEVILKHFMESLCDAVS